MFNYMTCIYTFVTNLKLSVVLRFIFVPHRTFSMGILTRQLYYVQLAFSPWYGPYSRNGRNWTVEPTQISRHKAGGKGIAAALDMGAGFVRMLGTSWSFSVWGSPPGPEIVFDMEREIGGEYGEDSVAVGRGRILWRGTKSPAPRFGATQQRASNQTHAHVRQF